MRLYSSARAARRSPVLDRRQVVIGLITALLFAGVLAVLGQARYVPTYLAALGAGVAIWWFLTDVAMDIRPASWHLAAIPSRRAPRGDDQRATRLGHRLTDLGASHSDPAVVYALLVSIIDDRLWSHHGIDRSRDPEGAARVLSPALRDFVQRQPPTRSLHSAKYLSLLVSQIEEL
jgi:hypothetical protein